MGCCSPSGQHSYTAKISRDKPGETGVLRHPDYVSGLTSSSDQSHTTMCQVLSQAFSTYRSRNCLGTKEGSSYVFKTFGEVEKQADELGAGLKSILRPGSDGLVMVGMYGKNRAEWVVADIALTFYGLVSVSLYDTLGKQAILHALSQTEMSAVITGNQGAATLLNLAKEAPLWLKTLVLWEDPTSDLVSAAAASHIAIQTYAEVCALGKALQTKRIEAQPDSLWTISYTSGTTGTPKGAMISHRAQVLGLASINRIVHFTQEDTHLSFLPLAHSFERNAVTLMLSVGGAVYFSSGSPPLLFSEWAEVKPTYIGAVPRVWKKIHDLLRAKIKAFAGEQAEIAQQGLEAKLARLHSTGTTTDSVWDARVFNATKEIIGGRCRVAVSGGAPIAQEVIDFLKVTLCTPFTEGYGQTECPGGICMTELFETQGGHVGGPGGSLEIKLVDVPELNFSTQPLGISLPSGEICVRGPLTFSGYYKAPHLTTEVVDSEGWQHTGDIGTLLPNGALKIIDRKKQMFKLSQGEYVAPEKTERVLANCPLVGHVWVHGDSIQDYCIAFVVPDEMVLPKWAASVGIQGDLTQICRDPRLLETVTRQFAELGRTAGLMSFEMPKRIRILEKPFSIELDQLTPTMKVKRTVLQTQFRKEIDEEYAKGPVS